MTPAPNSGMFKFSTVNILFESQRNNDRGKYAYPILSMVIKINPD